VTSHPDEAERISGTDRLLTWREEWRGGRGVSAWGGSENVESPRVVRFEIEKVPTTRRVGAHPLYSSGTERGEDFATATRPGRLLQVTGI